MRSNSTITVSRWVISFILVIGLHTIVAAALIIGWNPSPPVLPSAPAAVMLELAPLPEAPNNTPQEDPAPLTQEASDPTPIEPEPIKELDPLPEPPVEAPKPKIVINKKTEPRPIKKPIKKPVEKPIIKPKETTEDTKPKADITSTASTSSDKVSERVAAPTTTASNRPSKAQISWQTRLFGHIARYKRYPKIARNKRQEGTVSVNFTIDAQGRVLAKRIVKTSGHSTLDQEVLNLLDRAQPLPKPPTDILNGKNAREITIPINFNLKDKY